jgi:anaerobic dimethyl sulfoxide reductase subunit A
MEDNHLKNYLQLIYVNIWKFPGADYMSAPENLLKWIPEVDRELGTKLCREYERLQDPEYRNKMKIEYSDLFEGTNVNIVLPLWESAYKDQMNVLLDETTLSVVKEYYGRGLAPAVAGQPADYIGYETEYLLYLMADDRNEAVLRKFLHTHYIGLVQGVFGKVREYSKEGYYSALAQFLLANIHLLTDIGQAVETDQLANTDQSADQKDDTGCCDTQSLSGVCREHLQKCAPHFREISEKEAKKQLDQKIILTSGRGNCGGKCIIKAYTTAGCITHLESDVEVDGTDTIRACVRGRGYRKSFLAPERIRYPMVRRGERGEGLFQRISWEEAIQLIYEKLTEMTDKYGVGSRYVNYASGVSAVVRGDLIAKRLLALDGGYLDNYNTYSAACSEIAVPYTYGTGIVSSSMPTHKKAKLVIIWGFNPVVTLYNQMMFDLLKYYKEQKIPVIVIDPQYSDTAAVFATQWIGIRPGTDSALVSAMAYVLWKEELCDQKFMDKYCIGFDRDHMPEGYESCESYQDYIFGVYDHVEKTPEWAQEITGIPADTIYQLARQYASAKPATILAGLGPQRQANGEQTVRSVMVLPCMTGNVGVEGGSTGASGQPVQHMFPTFPAVENPYHASIPSFLWTDAVTRGSQMTRVEDHVRGREQLESNVKFIFNLAGNTLVNQHSDINKTTGILKDPSKCEFIVVSDLFMTASARYADLLLPGTSLFESNSMTTPWREGNYLLYGNQVIEPLFESRFEYDWLKELAAKMGIENLDEGAGTLERWHELIYNRLKLQETELPEFQTFCQNGGYKYRCNNTYIAFREQIEDIEQHPFPTESGKIEIFSRKLLAYENPEEIPPIPKYVPAFDGSQDPKIQKYPLQLIGWHTKRRCHSIHDHNEWMEEIEPHRVWINTEDAKERGIASEDLVHVYNERGIIQIKAHVSDRIIKGVACIPQGAWFTPDERGVDIRGSINTLSTLRPTPLAKGNPQHSNLVEIHKCFPLQI